VNRILIRRDVRAGQKVPAIKQPLTAAIAA
jgi:hypothetical protein